MSEIPRRALDAYNRGIKSLGAAAGKSVRAEMAAWLELNPGASVADARDHAIDVVTRAGEVYGGGASRFAEQLIVETAELHDESPPDPDPDWWYEPDGHYVDRDVRYAARRLDEGDGTGFLDELAGVARYYAERGANETMAHVAERQDAARSSRRGRGRGKSAELRFARVPTGPTTCAFCLMLGSRGFVYLDRKRAGEFNAYHRNCDCRIVPGYEGTTVAGYDPDELLDRWAHPENHPEDREARNARRRELYAEKRSAGDQTPEAGTAPGLPKLVETVDFGKTTADEVARRYERQIADEPVEHAIVITSGGEVWESVGDTRFVSITAQDLDLSGSTVTHNHVAMDGVDSSAPSDVDFNTFKDSGIAELRCVYRWYTYSIRTTDSTGRASWESARDSLEVFDISDDLCHDVLERLARDGYIDYTRS